MSLPCTFTARCKHRSQYEVTRTGATRRGVTFPPVCAQHIGSLLTRIAQPGEAFTVQVLS